MRLTASRRDMLAGLAALPLAHAAKAGSTALPDIVFILADDLGYADLSLTGSRHIHTPSIDRIGLEGVFLSEGYASTPVCSPTRTALLTGCYAQRFEIGLEEPLGPKAPQGLGVPHDSATLASVLRDRGYRTALVGKWHLGAPPEHGPLQHGYDSFFGIVEGAADYFLHQTIVGGTPLGLGLTQGNVPTQRDGYLTDILGDEAVRLIGLAERAPLFLSVHFTAPHWPWEGREDEALAHKLASSHHPEGGSVAKYREMTEIMDQNIGRILSAIAERGKEHNTIVVFTSDNGGERFSDTWPFVGHKGEVLEGGIRVPLLIRWPARIAPGTRSQQVMASMDFLPTLLSMTGGDPKAAGRFDGLDLSRQLTGEQAVRSRELFWRFNASEQAAVRRGDLKYVRIAGKEHLFDLSLDEREQANLIAERPQEALELRGLWDKWNAQMRPYRVGGFSQDAADTFSDRYH